MTSAHAETVTIWHIDLNSDEYEATNYQEYPHDWMLTFMDGYTPMPYTVPATEKGAGTTDDLDDMLNCLECDY